MHPSTNDWSKFYYTVSNWLLEREDKSDQLLKFQPVSVNPDDDWTDNFHTVIQWYKSKVAKKIQK